MNGCACRGIMWCRGLRNGGRWYSDLFLHRVEKQHCPLAARSNTMCPALRFELVAATTMSVVGISLGNDAAVIGQAGRGGVDIILNENSNRKTPCMVSVQGQQRYIGEAALSICRTNYKNTAREIKRLICRKWGDQDVMTDLERLPFTVVKDPNSDGLGIVLQYGEEEKIFTPPQVVAMLLTGLMDMTKKASGNNVAIADAVISIPGWYTDSMRRAMLDACQIAGLNCLRLMHETTAVALEYGIYRSYKGSFSAEKPVRVLFVDMGHSGFSACVCEYVVGCLTVKSTAYDRSLGGRDITWALAQHLGEEFKQKHGIDVRSKPKPMLKLLDAAEKAKKTLSPIGVDHAMINIESLAEDLDFTFQLKLEDLHVIIEPLLSRMDTPIRSCLEEAGILPNELDAVEIVGGGTRVPAIRRKIAEIVGADQNALNMGLSTTMNAEEAVARGCALQCAMLSSRFKVKEFKIVEAAPYPVCIHWGGSLADGSQCIDMDSSEGGDNVPETGEKDSQLLFKRGDSVPSLKKMVFSKRLKSFSLTVAYDNSAVALLPANTPMQMGSFDIEIPAAQTEGGPVTVRVFIKYDIHGITSVSSGTIMEEIKDVVSDKPDKSENASETAANPVPMDVEEPSSKTNGPSSESKEESAPAAESDAKMEEEDATSGKDAAAVPSKKKKFRKIGVNVMANTPSLDKTQLDLAVEAEVEMKHQDNVLQETANKRNELEAYIYSTRDKISQEWRQFMTEASSADFSKKLDDAEDWLYSDEGFESTKSKYSAKLEELRLVGNRPETRKREETMRPEAVSRLRSSVESYIQFVNSNDAKYDHIEQKSKDEVRSLANATGTWLNEKLTELGKCPMTEPASVTVKDIETKLSELHGKCKPIKNKPKPKPKPTKTDNKDKQQQQNTADKKDTTTPNPEAAAAGTASNEKESSDGATMANKKGGQSTTSDDREGMNVEANAAQSSAGENGVDDMNSK